MSSELYPNFNLTNQGALGKRVFEALLTVSHLLGVVELRADLRAWHTGSILVPYEGLDGLNNSKSDWFIFVIIEVRNRDYDSYVFDDKDIRGVVFMKTTELRMMSKYSEQIKDDSDKSIGFLLPLDRLPIQEFPMLSKKRDS